MSLDPEGYFWLSSPWIAGLAILAAIGLLLWCHRSLTADGSDGLVAAPVRGRGVPLPRRSDEVAGRYRSGQVSFERERRHANRPRVA
jgi:hypothetical protein